MGSTEKQKQSLYFPEDTLREIMKEANRLDRSLSWTVQQAWRVARAELRKFPTAGYRPEHERAPDSGESGTHADGIRASAEVREFLRGKFDSELTG